MKPIFTKSQQLSKDELFSLHQLIAESKQHDQFEIKMYWPTVCKRNL